MALHHFPPVEQRLRSEGRLACNKHPSQALVRVEDDLVRDRPLFCPICLYELACLIDSNRRARDRCYREFDPEEYPGACQEHEDWIERRFEELARMLGGE